MIINFIPLAEDEVRRYRSDNPSSPAADEVGESRKIIQFPEKPGQDCGFEFRPVNEGLDAGAPFEAKRTDEVSLKGRFKLKIFKPNRSEKGLPGNRGKILEVGIGTIPIDYFPEAV